MGQLVTVAQAAWLVRRDQRAVRYHLKRGDLQAQTGDDGHMRLDLDAVAAVVGWTIDAGRLAELRAQESQSPAGLLAQLERLAGELRAERELRRALERRLTALEGLIARALGKDDAPEALDTYLTRRTEDASVSASEGASMALGYGSGMVGAALSDLPRSASHGHAAIGLSEDARRIDSYPAPRPVTLADRGGGALTFRTRADAARWLVRHASDLSEYSPKTWVGWRDVDLTHAAVLGFALDLQRAAEREHNHRVLWRLHRCDDATCICGDLLSE